VPPADEVGECGWTKSGEIIRCPWHTWEFDIRTGEAVHTPYRLRTKTYETAVEPPEKSDSSETNAPTGADCSDSGDRPVADSNGTARGDETPVNTYPTDVENGVVVVYIRLQAPSYRESAPLCQWLPVDRFTMNELTVAGVSDDIPAICYDFASH